LTFTSFLGFRSSVGGKILSSGIWRMGHGAVSRPMRHIPKGRILQGVTWCRIGRLSKWSLLMVH